MKLDAVYEGIEGKPLLKRLRLEFECSACLAKQEIAVMARPEQDLSSMLARPIHCLNCGKEQSD